ncbi:RNA polymerase II mediator complex subunit Sin4 [Xylariaceae sp. FL0255]|nr:RNA polymerase II mediator complex subunit Sin4 [Xylariaceae sp. FL0255]
MANDAMPLIMDHPMTGLEQSAMQVSLDGVDDLFGDAVPLSLPSNPPSRSLRRRLGELRARASCHRLAWSKWGTIASISSDGQSLELRHLESTPEDGSWALSSPRVLTPWENLVGGPIVHLSWGPANPELAVIDSVGRVLLLSFNSDLNRPVPSRRWDGDSVDDLNAIVGTYWLNSQIASNSRYYPVYTPIKNHKGSDYIFETSGIPIMGPTYPNSSRSVFVCITRNGMLKMFWSQTNGKPEESTLDLESTTSADDLITHAAACSDRTRSIYVAMATASKQLQVVQVAISFASVKGETPQNVPPTAQVFVASLAKRHVAIGSWFPSGISESSLDSSMTKISHLEIVPGYLDFQTKQLSSVHIIVVRSYVPEPDAPFSHEAQSIIDRWELVTDQKQTVHPAFERLGARRNSAGSTPPVASRLTKLSSTIVNKIVMGVKVFPSGRLLAFYYNDGSIEYRDRFTMNEIYQDINLDRIQSILEAGFDQSGEASCLHIAFSPANCSLIQLSEDGRVKWHNLEYTLADPASISDGNQAAVIAVCASQAAAAASLHNNIDDILAVARKFSHQEHFASKLVQHLALILRTTVDYTEDIGFDALMRNSNLQLFLSIFNHLGWNGEFHQRHYRSKFATLALSIRNIIILISVANGMNPMRSQSSPLDEPEVVHTLAGCAKWSVLFLSWLCDKLFGLLNDREFINLLSPSSPAPQLAHMTHYLHSKNEIALHLILCSSTRMLITCLCRKVSQLESMASRAISWYATRGDAAQSDSRLMSLRAAYRKVHRHISAALVKADQFEAFLAALTVDIRATYNTSLPPLAEREKNAKNPQTPNQNPNAPKPDRVKEARQHCELSLFLVQVPAPMFLSIITKLFQKDLKELAAKVNTADLYFENYHLLEIVDTPAALASKKKRGVRVDMFKRVEINRGATRWKRCVRCGSVMEDPPGTIKPGLMFLLTQQRVCYCGGRIALLPPDHHLSLQPWS